MMEQNVKKAGLIFRILILAVLLVGTVAIAPGEASAQDGDGGQLIQDTNGIRRESFSSGEPTMPGFGSSPEILFEQTPNSSQASWQLYTSATNMGYLCLDDFWDLTEDIHDIHWYGMALNWTAGWYECGPTGMQFEIIFYQDSGGAPGAPVATFSNISPTVTYYDLYTSYSVYRFDVASLPTPVSLTEGWVSIQSTSSPNDCSFIWLDSPDGNLNAIQEGNGETNNNLAFALTGHGFEYGDAPEDALAYPGSLVLGAFPTCKDVTVAGYIEHDNFGAWFGPTFDFELDGNAGYCPSFHPNSYDEDECFNDGDAGLIKPVPYTLKGYVAVPCGGGSGTCEYEICLEDTYGDGWNGGIIDVSVNGNPVYTGLTLPTGGGPECHTISVENGDEITVDYTAGAWSYENEYYIYDSDGILVRSEGTGATTPADVLSGELYAVCASAGMEGGTPLGTTCQIAQWGRDIDIDVHNTMPGHEEYLPAYVNVLVDWNQDGQWGGSSACAGANSTPEHVLVNFEVPPLYIGTLSALGPADFTIGPKQGYVWTRFSITERPLRENWDGDGIFEDGETEDYLLRIDGERPVGGEAYPVKTVDFMALWVGLALAGIMVAGIFVLRLHRAR